MLQSLGTTNKSGKLVKKGERGPKKNKVKVKPYLLPNGVDKIPYFGTRSKTDPKIFQHMEAGFGMFRI